MSTNSSSDIVLSFFAEYKGGLLVRWDKCAVQLTRRFILLISQDGKYPIGKFLIPDIVNVSTQSFSNDRPFCLKIVSTGGSFHLSMNDENNLRIFVSYLDDIMKTSVQVRLRTHDMIFAHNNVDEEVADTVFAEILSSLFTCKNPVDLKHLLGKVNEYQKDTDISVLSFQKPYYINFVECLRYLSDDLVTNELMQYAVSLTSGFDDIVDDAMASDELLPTRVNIRDVFVGEGKIGEGKFGTVYVGTLKGSTEQIALKRIGKTNMNADDLRVVMKEASILYKLRRHPHIVGIRNFWEDDHNFYLVQDLMKGGELFEAIVRSKNFSEATAQRCIFTLLYTLDYCHQRGIVHRDLKPENLLLAERGKLDTIRIADFGLANTLDISNTLKSYCGTPGYIAPEIIRGQSYGPGVDMWSLGVIAYILLCGYHPFPQDNDRLMFHNISHGIFNFNGESWADKSDESKDFISRLLCADPSARMTARQAVTHRWMMFESKSTMCMNRALQELERFNARKTAHAISTVKAEQYGVKVLNYVAIADCLVYCNPTVAQAPLFSMPRGTVIAIDNVVNSSDGVWIHAFDNAPQGSNERNPAGKWILAGRKMDNPICIPSQCSVYMSSFKKGRTFHLVKKSPSRDEPIKFQVPGGFAMIADSVITNSEGVWIVINKQSLFQFNVMEEPPLYVCAILGSSILFNKIYGIE